MRRREFITFLGGAAAPFFWLALAASAQQPTIPVIGFLHSATAVSNVALVAAFRSGLSEAGYIEGQNVSIEYHWADNQFDRLSPLAADLVRREVAVIFAGGATNTSLVAKAATSTIPIVFANGGDPIELGLVPSLNRPGGNITGVYFLVVSLEQKKLELLDEVAPTASAVAALLNPRAGAAAAQLRTVEAAARALGLQLRILHASTDRDSMPPLHP